LRWVRSANEQCSFAQHGHRYGQASQHRASGFHLRSGEAGSVGSDSGAIQAERRSLGHGERTRFRGSALARRLEQP